ncbi:MAG TPA: sigma-E factor negative regulatory protein [Rhodoferax sp.]|nr:sigma-E factor negative regulatory protein [Rhodoferax sp.]HQC84942.1 sigma-E factor negative regulatory protein [Rhodoferax sp.]HQY75877.1 sigma-E factor negative regulatory protein [Rhodoferax sp.]
MAHPDDSVNDRISALVDGQLRGAEFSEAMDSLASQPEDERAWQMYHLIGDVLRSEELAGGAHDRDFLSRLEKKLAQEPVRTASASTRVFHAQGTSANAGAWRWISGVAVTVLVSVAGWGVWNTTSDGQQLASTRGVPVIAQMEVAAGSAEGPVMLRDPELDALMAAHQQLGGHSALQMPSGFLRNATFERPAR